MLRKVPASRYLFLRREWCLGHVWAAQRGCGGVLPSLPGEPWTKASGRFMDVGVRRRGRGGGNGKYRILGQSRDSVFRFPAPPHPTLPCHHKGILVRYPRKACAKGLRHRMRHRMPLTPRVCGESTGCASGLEVEVGAASPRRPGDNPLWPVVRPVGF